MKRLAKNTTGEPRPVKRRPGRPPESRFGNDALAPGGLSDLTPEQRRARLRWIENSHMRERQLAEIAGEGLCCFGGDGTDMVQLTSSGGRE